jgi:hypothetical protein
MEWALFVYVRRDDLISMFYVFIDLLLGQTPWAEAAKAKDRDAVLAAKEKVWASAYPRLKMTQKYHAVYARRAQKNCSAIM